MQVTVKGIHLDLGDALKTHVETVLGGLAEKYFRDQADAVVTFTKEKNHRYEAHVSIRIARGEVIEARAEALEPYPAFDSAAEKLASRLRRYKDKLRDHRRKEDTADLHTAAYVTLDAEADAAVGEEGPAVVAEMELPIQTLAVADAVMQLELRDLPALMFRNPAHGGYNLVYRRKDGNIGWVDPEGLPARKRAAG